MIGVYKPTVPLLDGQQVALSKDIRTPCCQCVVKNLTSYQPTTVFTLFTRRRRTTVSDPSNSKRWCRSVGWTDTEPKLDAGVSCETTPSLPINFHCLPTRHSKTKELNLFFLDYLCCPNFLLSQRCSLPVCRYSQLKEIKCLVDDVS